MLRILIGEQERIQAARHYTRRIIRQLLRLKWCQKTIVLIEFPHTSVVIVAQTLKSQRIKRTPVAVATKQRNVRMVEANRTVHEVIHAKRSIPIIIRYCKSYIECGSLISEETIVLTVRIRGAIFKIEIPISRTWIKNNIQQVLIRIIRRSFCTHTIFAHFLKRVILFLRLAAISRTIIAIPYRVHSSHNLQTIFSHTRQIENTI